MTRRHYAFIVVCAIVGSIIGWHIDLRNFDFDPDLIVLVPE